MKEIDLHGVLHADVENIIIQACAYEHTPFIVITGRSDAMKNIVNKTVSKFQLTSRVTLTNPGRLVIDEKR